MSAAVRMAVSELSGAYRRAGRELSALRGVLAWQMRPAVASE